MAFPTFFLTVVLPGRHWIPSSASRAVRFQLLLQSFPYSFPICLKCPAKSSNPCRDSPSQPLLHNNGEHNKRWRNVFGGLSSDLFSLEITMAFEIGTMILGLYTKTIKLDTHISSWYFLTDYLLIVQLLSPGNTIIST